jgi:hypothetical protein
MRRCGSHLCRVEWAMTIRMALVTMAAFQAAHGPVIGYLDQAMWRADSRREGDG